MSKRALLPAILIVYGSWAGAQSDPQARPIEELTITATRWSAEQQQRPAHASSIDREEIEASASRDLLDLLRRQAGIDLARNGGPGGQTSVFMRGTNSNHVLVLIDGVRVAAAGTGAFQWENLPLSQIERIDLVRGPQASLYGSDAIGGVVNIVTRRPAGAQARIEFGSHASGAAELSLAGGSAGWRYWLTAGHLRTDGFDATTADSFFNNPDDDGHRNTSISAGLSGALGATHDLRVSLMSRAAEVEFDQGESDNDSHQLAVRITGRLGHNTSHTAQLALVDDVLETMAFGSKFETRRYELDWQFSHQPDQASHWTLGLSALDEQGRSANEFDVERSNLAVFGAWQRQLGRHLLQLSARRDDNDAKTTGRVGWQSTLTPAWSVQLSHGTGFRQPNFNELYSPGFPFGTNPDGSPAVLFAGNPALDPEQSRSSELGLVHASQIGGLERRFSATAYATRIDNLIAFQGDAFSAVNIGEAQIDGLELDYHTGNQIWAMGANLTWQDPVDGVGNPLLRRAEEKFTVTAQRWFDRLQLGSEILFSGERQDFDRVLDEYWLVNLRGRYDLTPTWTVEARLENLLDEDYSLASGFTAAGRGAWLGLRWRP